MELTSSTLRVRDVALRAHRFGDPEGELVLCVHGISANARGFDPLAAALARKGRRVVSVDLRGRGHSTCSPPGTYGWKNHARDVLEAATALSAERFTFIGHSMGAYVGMQAAALAPSRVERLVLIDAVGFPEPAAMPPILSAVERLGRRHRTVDEYLERVRALGTVEPWNEHWERYFRYELFESEDGVVARTSRQAVLEDMMYGTTQDPTALWPSLRDRPVLLVRAARPLGRHGGFIVPEADRDRFLRAVPNAHAVDVDENHYGVLMAPGTFEAIRRFLS